MIASLPMYDPPALHAANDRLWRNIRRHLGHAPQNLTRGGDLWDVWLSPDLVLAQTCGLPFRQVLHSHVTLVAAPHHDLPNARDGTYHSVFVARRTDTRRFSDLACQTFAVNDAMSQSGWAAPMLHLQDLHLSPTNVTDTGSHHGSALAVANGRADMAALDCVTWAILADVEPALTTQLRVIATTDATPALPFITARDRDPAPLRAALAQAIADLSPCDRNRLKIQGIAERNITDYTHSGIPSLYADAHHAKSRILQAKHR
jgi:ABC-type phosphate/phosphonate transport system substrate-binding protein